MGKKYNTVNISDLLETTALKTKEYNDKQEYIEDDKTYFQFFNENAQSLIQSTKENSKYTSDESTGDLILDIGDKKIDITNYTDADYKDLSDKLSHNFARKEMIDILKREPELSDLNQGLSNGDISVDTDRVYASVSYVGSKSILPRGELIFSIEAKEDSYGSLNSESGVSYIAWSPTSNEGVSHLSLMDGLKSTQSYLNNLEAEAALDVDEPEQKSKSSFRP